MTLDARANGSGEANRIKAAWFNDIRDLLVGNMVDQPISPKARITNQAKVAKPSGTHTCTAASGSGLTAGVYKYRVANTDANNGSTLAGPTVSVTVSGGNLKVNVASIPLGGSGTTKRTLLRTKHDANVFYVLTTINDNTTTTFADTTPDASLTVLYTDYPTMGGSYEAVDSTGATQAAMTSDGQVRGENFWVNPQPLSGQEPQVDLVIGDNDTGFKWVSDGVFDIYVNGTQLCRIDTARSTSSAAPIAFISGGTGRIFIGSSTPAPTGGLQDGDVWIDTSTVLG